MIKKYLLFLSIFVFVAACFKPTTNNLKLSFVDEYIVPDTLKINNTKIGGISGIDFYNGAYYLVIDDAANPRFVKASLFIDMDTISYIDFKEVIVMNDSLTNFYDTNVLDLESIFIHNNQAHFVSEGAINRGKDPSVFITTLKGDFIKEYQIPSIFKAHSNAKPKHNASFEGSSKSIDKKGFWVAMEGVLGADGEEPSFSTINSPIRISYFPFDNHKAVKQFAYMLEPITRPSKGTMNVNGVTSILEYKTNHFFVIERTYQSGYGKDGNIIRIFEATIDKESTDVLAYTSLKETPYVPLKKRLLLDFDSIKDHLSLGFIDNIEGITFGPTLNNGNKSLLIVSDDNFQLYGKQLSQFILLEMIE